MDDGGGQFHQILYTVVEFISQVVYLHTFCAGSRPKVDCLFGMRTSHSDSHAKTTGIWPRMFPLYLHIGGCNACYRGILLVLVAWAVHDILGNPNFMRIAGTQIWDHGKKWVTSCGTHIYLHLLVFAACKYHLCTYSAFCACALKRARHWRAGLT